jgi:hypothetical protein
LYLRPYLFRRLFGGYVAHVNLDGIHHIIQAQSFDCPPDIVLPSTGFVVPWG